MSRGEPSPIDDLARRINAVGAPRGVAYVSGGGTEVFPMLLARGGGSATLLAGRIPYDPLEFQALLGCDPGKLVDPRAARGLAMAAFRHALTLRGGLPPGRVFGLGSTSKLARGGGERPGRSHEIHAALQAAGRTSVRSVTLPPGMSRAREERINALLLLNLVAEAKGVGGAVPLESDGHRLPDSAVEERAGSLDDLGGVGVDRVLVGDARWVAAEVGDGPVAPAPPDPPRLLLPGSFRPVHEGHLAMAGAASGLVGHRCDFEVSLFHPDKPPLDYVSLRARLGAFQGHPSRVYLTDAPTYLDKARLFPGCTFAVGHDTAERVVAPRYYGGPEARDRVLDELEALGTRFVVFGRVDASGRFRDFNPGEFEHPAAGFLGRVAVAVPGHEFRLDLSSTEVRARLGGDFP